MAALPCNAGYFCSASNSSLGFPPYFGRRGSRFGPCGSPSRLVYGRLFYGDGMFRVAPFFRAASATLALKAGAWLRRLGLIC